MARSIGEIIGMTGNLDVVTTGRSESPLAHRLRTEARLKALESTGIKTGTLKSAVVEAAKPR